MPKYVFNVDSLTKEFNVEGIGTDWSKGHIDTLLFGAKKRRYKIQAACYCKQ